MSDYQQPPVGGMYEEIDLRPYIQALIEKWLWIVGAGLIAGVLAFLIASLLPVQYEATALVATTDPRFNIRFDPRLETTERTPVSSLVYAELALSDDIVQALYEGLTVLPEGVETPFGLRELLAAESGAEASLLRLTATHTNAQTAANLANQWADIFLGRASQIYGSQGEAPLAFLEAQLSSSALELEQAEQALILFQEENQSRIYTSQLLGYETALTNLVDEQQQARATRQEVLALREQLAGQPSNVVSLAEELTAVLLQLKSYGLSDQNIQFLINDETTLMNMGRPAQIAFLDDLAETLAAKEENVAAQIARLEPEIRTVQKQLQETEARSNQLTTARNIAQETLTTLARSVAEARIGSQDTTGQIQLASQAGVPVEPESRGRVLTTAVALFLGGIIMIVFILGRVWWLTGQPEVATKQ